jgi:hypothetical protein
VFGESLKSEISQWGLKKINFVDFLGIGNFLSNFPKQIIHGQERIENF